MVDQAVFRSMFIATQRLGRNVSEAAYAVHRVMKEMNVEANALTFGQYAQSLNQGKAVRALSSDDSEKKKSPTQKLKDVCSSKSFRAMMNKNKNTERKYVVQMFGEKSVVSDTKKKNTSSSSSSSSTRPKSWAHKTLNIETSTPTPPGLSLRLSRRRTPTLSQLATAAATASSPDVQNLENKRRNCMSAGNAIDLKRVMRTRRSSHAQRRLSLSPAVVAAASKDLKRRSSSNDEDVELERNVSIPTLSVSVSPMSTPPPTSATSSTSSSRVQVLMWCRTPVGGDDVKEFSLLDEEMLASWSLRPELRRHNDQLNPPYGEPFVPRLKYCIKDPEKKEIRGDVKYVSPVQLRLYLEETIELHGYGILHDLAKTSPFL